MKFSGCRWFTFLLPLGILLFPVLGLAQSCPQLVGPVQNDVQGFGSGPTPTADVAQTFIVSNPGRIQAVELYCSKPLNGTALDVVIVELRETAQGVPSENTLVATETPLSALPAERAWRRFEFGAPGPLVQPGVMLAVVVRYQGSYRADMRGNVEWFPVDPAPACAAFGRAHGSVWRRFSAGQNPPVNYDFAYRVIACEEVVPAVAGTWGELKSRYR